jgi:hypothetical protein
MAKETVEFESVTRTGQVERVCMFCSEPTFRVFIDDEVVGCCNECAKPYTYTSYPPVEKVREKHEGLWLDATLEEYVEYVDGIMSPETMKLFLETLKDFWTAGGTRVGVVHPDKFRTLRYYGVSTDGLVASGTPTPTWEA